MFGHLWTKLRQSMRNHTLVLLKLCCNICHSYFLFSFHWSLVLPTPTCWDQLEDTFPHLCVLVFSKQSDLKQHVGRDIKTLHTIKPSHGCYTMKSLTNHKQPGLMHICLKHVTSCNSTANEGTSCKICSMVQTNMAVWKTAIFLYKVKKHAYYFLSLQHIGVVLQVSNDETRPVCVRIMRINIKSGFISLVYFSILTFYTV